MASLDEISLPDENYEIIEVADGDYMIQVKRCTQRGRTGKPWFTDPLNGLEYPQEEGVKVDGIWYCSESARDVLADKKKKEGRG